MTNVMKLPIIATLGGHSALEICLGAKKQGFRTLAVVVAGRDKTYTKYFRNLIDESITVGSFGKLLDKEVVKNLQSKRAVFIPHRYIQVYCNLEEFEKKLSVPVFGNKYLLKYEERYGPINQYQFLYDAGVEFPTQFKDPKEIDRLVIVKVREAQRSYERAFFFARNPAEFQKRSQSLMAEGKINEKDLSEAVIEEYLIGAQVNFNFFYSPLDGVLQLLGTDIRRQTNIDGIIRIPTVQQIELLQHVSPSYIESGHIAVTVKESLLEKAFFLAQKLVDAVQTFVPPGIIGPFALQTAIIPGPPKETIVVYDVSLRIPGSPGTASTPYSQYHFERSVSFGERIAMEIKEAVKGNKLDKVTT